MTLCEAHSPAPGLERRPENQRRPEKLFVVLMADDDRDDYLLVKKALEAGPIRMDLRWVSDRNEAVDYLLRRANYTSKREHKASRLRLGANSFIVKPHSLDDMQPRRL